MHERIKRLRKALDLTQREFGERIGVKPNTIATYEIGRNKPIDAVISLICKTFNVSEKWLRTGEGEMFDQREKNIIDQLCAELYASELDTEIIRAYFRIDPRIREPFMRHLIQEVQAKSAAPSPMVDAKNATATPVLDTTGQERTELDIVTRLAELERQNQELTAKVAAMEEEDALLGLTDAFSVSPSASAGSIRPSGKVKK